MDGYSKLRGPARRLMADLAPQGTVDPASEIAVLVRGRDPFTPDQLTTLESEGLLVRSVAGDVLSANLPAKDLQRLADHDFVVAIELSQTLSPEAARREPRGHADVE